MNKTEYDEKIINKWKPTGMLQGLEQAQADKMATLLENTAQWIARMNDEKKQKVLLSAAIPIVRLVFQDLDYEVATMPVVLNDKQESLVMQVYPTSVTLQATDDQDLEPEEYERVAEGLKNFFQERMADGHRLVAYTPFVYDYPGITDGKVRIKFRGRFVKA